MQLTRIMQLVLLTMMVFFISCDKEETASAPPSTPPVVEVTVTASDFTASMDENPSADQIIGNLQGSTNSGNVTYSLVSQSVENAFNLNSTTGELLVMDYTKFDFESHPSITAQYAVTNGDVSETASITIDLNNLVLDEAEGLMSFYPFDNDDVNGTTALDVTSNERHGTVHNAQLVADRWDNYAEKKAYTFGNGAYITVPSFGTDIDAFSISAWVYDNGAGGDKYRCIVSKAGAGREYVFRVNKNPCGCLGAHFTSGTNGLHTGAQFESGVWKHLVMVYENATVSIYEDGVMAANKTSMNAINWGSNDISIGALTASGNENWFGEIDDVAFFNRVLTLDEINLLSSDR